MKLCAIVLICLCATATTVFAQDESVVDIFGFIKGFGLGLHFERLSPTIEVCTGNIKAVVKAFSEAFQAFAEHQPFYGFMNNVTLAMGTVPRMSRSCVLVPGDVWKNLQERYFKQFNYSWENYFHAVFLNLGFKMDEIVYNLLKAKSYLELHDFLNGGYFSGCTLNVIFNVTSDKPIPPPPPIEDDTPMTTAVGTNWTDIHHKFREYYNYTMIAFNYTRWVNATTSKNLNSSVMNIEMKAYTALMLLNNPKEKNILEAVLTAIDILDYMNVLFNAIYFTVEQVPMNILKDSIIQHFSYAPVNSILHIGYVGWDSYKIVTDLKEGNYRDLSRRIAVIFRKLLYFDDDTLDEIFAKVPIADI